MTTSPSWLCWRSRPDTNCWRNRLPPSQRQEYRSSRTSRTRWPSDSWISLATGDREGNRAVGVGLLHRPERPGRATHQTLLGALLDDLPDVGSPAGWLGLHNKPKGEVSNGQWCWAVGR